MGLLSSNAHIGRVRLRVADLERSVAFYRDLLGLGITRDEGPRITLHEFLVLEERPGIVRRPRRPVSTGLYHVALLVPDRRSLGRALLALRNAEYPLRGMSDHTVSESLYLDDPDGNGLEIYADRPRSSWPVQDGVVQMTVDPMDVASVVASGRERPEPWNGLPAQTTIGHLHLTVAELEPALEFYRDVIGFDQMMTIPSLAAVSAGGYHHHLNLNTWAGDGAPPDSDRVAGLSGWELREPDEVSRKALLERLRTSGRMTDEPGGQTARDPDSVAVGVAG